MPYHSGNELLDPHLIFEKIHLQPGMHVADLGCGRTGHMIFPAANIIGEKGVIYAVDIMKDVLQNILKRARLDGFHNVHTVWSNIELLGKTAIPEKTLDIAMLVNTLFHSKVHSDMLDEAARLLKEKARMLVVDWVDAGLPFGPSHDELVNFESIKKWAFSHGFVLQEEFEAGKYHKGLVLFKS